MNKSIESLDHTKDSSAAKASQNYVCNALH